MTTPSPVPTDAIIFLPGIGGEWTDQTADGIAQRIAASADRHARTGTALFGVEVREEKFGDGLRSRVHTISRKDGDKATAALDIYSFEYRDVLMERHERQQVLLKLFWLTLAIVGTLGRMLPAVARRSKTMVEKLQLLYGVSILSLLSVYAAVLLVALYQTAAGMAQEQPVAGWAQQAISSTCADSANGCAPGTRPPGPSFASTSPAAPSTLTTLARTV